MVTALQDDCLWIFATRFVYCAGTVPKGRDCICAGHSESSRNRRAHRGGLSWAGPADGAGAQRGRDGLAQKEGQRPGLRILSQMVPGAARGDAAKKFFTGDDSCSRRSLNHSEGPRSGAWETPSGEAACLFCPFREMLSTAFAQVSHSPLGRELEKQP